MDTPRLRQYAFSAKGAAFMS